MLRKALQKRNFPEDATINQGCYNNLINPFQFNGSFPSNCQQESRPSSLKFLIPLIFNGTNLKAQGQCETQACLTVGSSHYNTKES